MKRPHVLSLSRGDDESMDEYRDRLRRGTHVVASLCVAGAVVAVFLILWAAYL